MVDAQGNVWNWEAAGADETWLPPSRWYLVDSRKQIKLTVRQQAYSHMHPGATLRWVNSMNSHVHDTAKAARDHLEKILGLK